MGTTLDSEVLRDLFGTPEARTALDARALVQGWLDAERALAQAEAEVGVIPSGAAARIAAEADASLYDLDELRAGIEESDHPLVPLVRALVARCGDAGRYVHWGATTQDVIDTGAVLQIRAVLVPIQRDLRRATIAAAGLALRHAATPMAGRTHGQHAVPITFGLKAAGWADELGRAEERLGAAREAVLTAQLGGAAGTLAALGADGPAVRAAFSRLLDLAEPAVPWHAARDRLRDLLHALVEIAAAGERIAAEIVRMQSTELGEAREPAGDGAVGSSTMPQKRNPMVCEYVIAAARLLRGPASVVEASAAHAHERDMGAWATEWIAVPEALVLAAGLLDKLARVLEGLEVDAERMLRNLELTGGGIMAEAVMMSLASAVGHEEAHAAVTAASRRAAESGAGLRAALLDDPGIAASLDGTELDGLLDPTGYLGLAADTACAASATAAADGEAT
jgi:adenylosuccinate lyase/3-carboxy-cis,cis-muconate cycloisomerase